MLVFVASNLQAQKFYRKSEYGFGGGAAHYFGDLNQKFQLNFPRESVTAFIKYNITPYIALKLGANYGHIGFDDKYVKNSYQQKRNLNFENQIIDVVFQSEFNFFNYNIGDYYYRFTPYVTLGFGYMQHNPYSYYNKTKTLLRPLGTEGQNLSAYSSRKYKTHGFVIPIGIGAKYWLAKGTTLGLEFAYRYTSTDYLDDVSTTYVGKENFVDNSVSPPFLDAAYYLQDRSIELGGEPLGIQGRQRGISSTKDHYLLAQFTISFRLPTYKCPSDK